MIRTHLVTKVFGEQQVLKGITYTFDAGKTNLIIGRSGAGKTVLLKLLVGLMKPTTGDIFYEQTNIAKLNDKQLKAVRMQVGMLFQGSALFDSMSVEENIRFRMDMFTNWTLKEKIDKVNVCLGRVGLENQNKKYPSELSGGMQKRVGIARAIALDPKYLFCDEPNSGLDPKTALVIDELIHDITKEYNITTVINTHDMNSVMEIGENIAFIHKGNLHWSGNKDEVLTSENKELQEFIFASPFLQRLRERALAN